MNRMEELEKYIASLEAQEKENAEKAKLADEVRKMAEEKINEAKRNKVKAEEARKKLEEYENILNSFEDSNAEQVKNTESNTNKGTNNVSKLRFASGFLAGVAALSLLGGAYVLCKKGHTSSVKGNFTISQVLESKKETEEYEELTEEKFVELSNSLYRKYVDQGLAVTEEDVMKYAMIVNIDQLAEDNPKLIDAIINGKDTDEIFGDANLVLSTIMTENYRRWCELGLGVDSFINASDAVFDKKQKTIVQEYERRVFDLAALRGNPVEFNKELSIFLRECLDSRKELFNLEAGSGYATMMIIMNIIRGEYTQGTNLLDSSNAETIKYFVNYADDSEHYENNSRSTAYYRGINDILSDCKTKKLVK